MRREARRQKFLRMTAGVLDGTLRVVADPERRVLFDDYLARARARVMGGA